MNKNAQNGSLCNVTIAPPPPQMVGFAQIGSSSVCTQQWSCELIVLRVVTEVITFNNSNFTAVKKNGFDANGGGVEPQPPSGYATDNV